MTIQAGGEAKDAAIYFSTPYNQASATKNCAIIVEGRSHYSRNNFHICISNYGGNDDAQPVGIADAALTITPHDKRVHIPGSLSVSGTFSNSDASLKTNVNVLASADALALLRAVQPMVYDRIDGPQGRRAGFIAQHVQTALAGLPLDCDNLVQSTASDEVRNSDGEVVAPADPGILQIDYSRLGSPILWTVCKNLLARIEALEAAAAP